jgi:hypothetical protein
MSYNKFCKVCKDAGKTEKEYSSHFVKDKKGPDGKVICPLLLSIECRYCKKKVGHTVKNCPILKKKQAQAQAEQAQAKAKHFQEQAKHFQSQQNQAQQIQAKAEKQKQKDDDGVINYSEEKEYIPISLSNLSWADIE